MVITYFFRRILMFLAVLFICPFVAYGAETCSAGQMLIDGACIEPEFTITTTEMSAGATFSFQMSASGVFYVDFDDGRGVQKIDRTNDTTNTIYTSAAYSTAGTHTIKMYGDATGYTTLYGYAVISFSGNTNIKTVDGSLGAIFGGNTPYMFYYTFYGCTSLQSIPVGLFSGVTGSGEYMFADTFNGCTSLESIPADLFSGVTGSSKSMFYSTFRGCTSLESIPADLFSGVKESARSMFKSTFRDCTSLQSIHADLFSGVKESAREMFSGTFINCASLASLPDGLFKNIEGKPANSVFSYTFLNCTNLSGYIPADTFAKMDSTDFDSATMDLIFSNTALDKSCPAGTHQYITGFESAWGGRVACVPCPAGTTSAAGASDISHCVGGRTLHIGDDITMNLTTTRPTTPRVMVFQVLDELYYGGLSDTEKTINKNTDKKFRIFFDNKDYWLHDYTVE